MDTKHPLPLQELSKTFLFQNVDIHSLDKRCPFLTECTLTDYMPGTVIHSAIAPLDGLAYICHGTANVLSDTSGNGALIRTLSKGDFIGVSTIYSDSRGYNTAVRTRTECTVFLIPTHKLKQIIANDPNVSENYIRFLTERICFLNRKISAFTAGSAEAKLAVYLLGLPQDDAGRVEIPCSLSALAEMLNMGRASLYRALDTFCSNGDITRDGKKINIIDKNSLSNIF